MAKLIFGLLLTLASSLALAHHGWHWTEDGQFEVIGLVEKVTLGEPHGVLLLDVDGEKWTAVVGHPDRNKMAGLVPGDFKVGMDITVRGQRAADLANKQVKVVTLEIAGRVFDLYPQRAIGNSSN